jgi:hypothetical protein
MARATRNRRPSRAVDLNRAIIISPPISQIARLETPDVPLRGFFARIYHLLVALAHHHVDIAAPAPAAHKPRRPIRHRHLSAISLGHFGRIGFCPVPTIGKTQGPQGPNRTQSNAMECCRRGGDHSFSWRLPVRDSACPGPGHRGDLPNTFGQLSYPKLTFSRFHLLLPRIGDRNSGRHIGTLSQSATGSLHQALKTRCAAAVLPSVTGGPGLDFIRHSVRFRVFRAPIYLVQAVFDLTDHLVDCSDRPFVSRQTAERQIPRQIVH